jgi:hypothetical protein
MNRWRIGLYMPQPLAQPYIVFRFPGHVGLEPGGRHVSVGDEHSLPAWDSVAQPPGQELSTYTPFAQQSCLSVA